MNAKMPTSATTVSFTHKFTAHTHSSQIPEEEKIKNKKELCVPDRAQINFPCTTLFLYLLLDRDEYAP